MELKIFRDTLPQGGAGCTVKAELPLETEIRISDDLPPVGTPCNVRSCCSMPPSASAVMTSVLHWVCTVTTNP